MTVPSDASRIVSVHPAVIVAIGPDRTGKTAGNCAGTRADARDDVLADGPLVGHPEDRAVGAQQQFRRPHFAVVVEAHREAVRARVVDQQQIAHAQLRPGLVLERQQGLEQWVAAGLALGAGVMFVADLTF